MQAAADSNVLVDELRERIRNKRAIAVIGAGVSSATTGGNPLASWKGLLLDGVQRCEQLIQSLPESWGDIVRRELNSGDMDDLLSAANKIEAKLKRIGDLGRWLISTVGQFQIVDPTILDAIQQLRIPLLTTNYDGLIEKRLSIPHVTWRDASQYERVIQGEREGVIHLHGFYEDTDSVVLGVKSYEAVLGDQFAQTMQQAITSLHSLIFIGFGKGLEDPNFASLLDWATKTFGDSPYRHYRLVSWTPIVGQM